ncbi:hypothetical protein AK812_SmicGene11353, partial [Symbiodinium microadriaticum]
MDAAQGPDSDDYFKATGRNASCDVETRVQKLNFLSTSAQKDQPDGREPQAAKAKKDKKSKPEEDEHVLELLKIHAGGKKKKDNTGSIYTTSQSEIGMYWRRDVPQVRDVADGRLCRPERAHRMDSDVLP